MPEDEDNIIHIFDKNNNLHYYYEKLEVLEFTSERKRMSVIVRNKLTDQIEMHTKGADNIILNLIDS